KGSLKMFGSISNTAGSILLNKSEVYAFYRSLRIRETRQLFVKEAAVLLGCDHEVIKSLVQQGILLGEKTKRGLVVYEESIKEFNGKFIACSKVAGKLKTSSKVVVEIAKAYNLTLVVARRCRDKSPQSFFPIDELVIFGLNERSFS
ncbi:MAG: hypothetical protein Q9M44_05260, partial [Ghiorsea sp.]|nr:hypothetical protein [Ghiorsea sp.]